MVNIRNIVLYPKDGNKVDIEVYEYHPEGWKREKVIKDYQQAIDTTLFNGRVSGQKASI
jgi:hypothetical protein